MAILLIAEHNNATLSDQTAKALSAALKIGSDIHVLLAGKDAKPAADAAAKLKGVSKVLLAEADELQQHLAEPLAALVVSLAGSYDTIIAPATASGKNVTPRVAALLDVMQVSEIVEVASSDTFKRPIYAGNAIQTVQATDAKKVITVRTASFQAASEGGSASVEEHQGRRQSRPVGLRRESALPKTLDRSSLRPTNHHRWGSRARVVGEVPGSHPPSCRQARRRRRRLEGRR